ncbi:oligosaccharyltransferase complex subunit beta [Cryptococcus neoformans Ze90-1]|nr:oligosaccharyltransferase complex subunit beta [Cryptococcus neoformans var. grubii Ze90-1]
MRASSMLLMPFVALFGLVSARSATGDRVLVVLESAVTKDDYSQFWDSLKQRGFELTFKEPKSKDADLVKFGEAQYDHLIMFAPTAKDFSPSISPKTILDSQFKGLNALYILSPQLSEVQREHLREYDLEFVPSDLVLIDPFSNPSGESASTVLLPPTECAVSNGAVLSDTTLTGGPIAYPSGTVHAAGLNPYLIDVLHAPKKSYIGQDKVLNADEIEVEKAVGGKKSKDALQTGKKAGLVSALQTRDNARAGFVGSGEVFSDKYWGKTVETVDGKKVETGNAAFVTDFTKWVFQETGVVKVVSTTHFREGETEPREMYTKKDDITYSLTLAQYVTNENGTSSWGPFHADDIQMDFTMLDPHIRTAMIEDKFSSSADATTYQARFIAPDRHGVFKFVVEYWRPGWSYIRTSSTASVVPLRHDEYPRFITGAWPYYIAAISTSVTFLAFVAIWLSLGEGDRDRKGKKKAE